MDFFKQGSNRWHGYGLHRPRLSKGAIRTIIMTNVVVFFVVQIFQFQNLFNHVFGLVPRFVWSRGFIWQPLTYLFMHGGFWHIFWNMLILWMFGSEIESHWGKKEFFKYYFLTGVCSGIITMLFNLSSTIPVVGASGAIYGILGAFAILFPERRIYFYFFIPIKAKYFVIFIGIFSFFSSLNPGYSYISHLTHLSGLLIGAIYLKRYNILRLLLQKTKVRRVSKKNRGEKKYDTDETLREEVDRILDKINQEGYGSLTDAERQTLDLASAYFAEKEKDKN